MILRVAAKELIRGYRLWVGSLIAIVASSAVCAAVLAQFATAATLTDAQGDELLSMSRGIIAFSLLAAVAVTAATTNLAVASGCRGYALLQIAGVLPRQIVAIVLTQLVMLAVIGSGIGVGLGRLIAQPLLNLAVTQTSVPIGTTVIYGAGTVAWTFGLFVAVTVMAGLRAAVRAGRVPPIDALREPEPPRIRMGALRWIATGAAGLAALGLGLGAASMSPSLTLAGHPIGASTIIGLGMMFSIALTGLAASLGPVLYPLVLRAWTALVPSRLSGAWFLARRSCRYRITQSTAAITPLTVGIALPGSLYTLFLTTSAATSTGGRSEQINSVSIFTILGPALLLAAIGSAAVIFMTSRTRARDNALVTVSGGTLATTVFSAAFEAVIYVITALLTAAMIFGLVGVVVATAFSHTTTGVLPVYGVSTALLIAGIGTIIVGAATVLPAIAPQKQSIPTLLATE